MFFPSRAFAPASEAKVLVASDDGADLEQLVDHLKHDYREVGRSLDPNRAVAEFERLLPQVIVLAFENIRKSDGYLLSLYRHSKVASSHPHRTVLLCTQADVRDAYELCRKGCYDDYALYWPMAQDGLRLSMSVWNAAREVLAEARKPSTHQLEVHAEQLDEAQAFLSREIAGAAEFQDTATAALDQVEDAVGAAIDGFGRRVDPPSGSGKSMVRDPAAFHGELDRLKREDIPNAFRAAAGLFRQAAAWPGQAGRRLQSVAVQAHTLAKAAPHPRRMLMIVEDDPVQQELIAGVLEPTGVEIVMLPDGASLLGALRRAKPTMILMDINLPDVDGVALTRIITGLPRLAGVPVLMLTGEASKESLAKSIEAGAVGYIVKPFTPVTLLRNIDRYLPKAAS